MKRKAQGRKPAQQVAAADSQERARRPVNGQLLRDAVTWIVNDRSFADLKLHGNTKWLVCDLVVMAVLWVWSDHRTLTGAFAEAYAASLSMLGRAAVDSYQGFMWALVSVTGELLPLLWTRFQALMERHGGEHWRIFGWLPLAVDGSRVSTPRTADNERAFCAPNFGRSRMAEYRRKKRRQNGAARRRKKAQPPKPQIWLTLLWHMGLRLLWSWRTGPSNSSERGHLLEMLKTLKFPIKTLFCGDAGFVGYDFWRAIGDQGHHFLMRVGSNVILLRKLGYVRESHGLVYCWPSKAARKSEPPLVLRLLSLKLGQTPVWLVTNILDPHDLPAEAACQLYQLRWGIELQFRTLKQTFGKGKLRSRTPDRALRELDWSLLGLTMIQLLAVKEQVAIGLPPANSSAALAIDAIRDAFHHFSETPNPACGLKAKLRGAVTDQYKRSKKSKQARYRPENSDKPSAGKPKLVAATHQHKRQLRQYLAIAI
jgi:hypothetical protein